MFSQVSRLRTLRPSTRSKR